MQVIKAITILNVQSNSHTTEAAADSYYDCISNSKRYKMKETIK